MKVEGSYLLKKGFPTSASNSSISFAAERSSSSWLAAVARPVQISDCFNVFWSTWIHCWSVKPLVPALTHFLRNVFIPHFCSHHSCIVAISFCHGLWRPQQLERRFWLLEGFRAGLCLGVDWEDKIEEENLLLLSMNDRDDEGSMFLSWKFDWMCKSLENELDILKK